MLANLVYNAATMLYEAMPKEDDIKIALIKDVGLIEEALNQPAMDWERFEMLMSLSIPELQRMAEDQSDLLDKIKKENPL